VVKRYLTPAELSEELGIGIRTVYTLISEGQIPHVRLRRSIRIPSSVMDELLERQSAKRARHENSPVQVEID
jgi:excisionase family DNA binding protein